MASKFIIKSPAVFVLPPKPWGESTGFACRLFQSMGVVVNTIDELKNHPEAKSLLVFKLPDSKEFFKTLFHEGLYFLPKIECLTVVGGNVPLECMFELCKFLRTNRTLRVIDLQRKDWGVTTALIQRHFVDAIAKNPRDHLSNIWKLQYDTPNVYPKLSHRAKLEHGPAASSQPE